MTHDRNGIDQHTRTAILKTLKIPRSPPSVTGVLFTGATDNSIGSIIQQSASTMSVQLPSE